MVRMQPSGIGQGVSSVSSRPIWRPATNDSSRCSIRIAPERGHGLSAMGEDLHHVAPQLGRPLFEPPQPVVAGQHGPQSAQIRVVGKHVGRNQGATPSSTHSARQTPAHPPGTRFRGVFDESVPDLGQGRKDAMVNLLLLIRIGYVESTMVEMDRIAYLGGAAVDEFLAYADVAS